MSTTNIYIIILIIIIAVLLILYFTKSCPKPKPSYYDFVNKLPMSSNYKIDDDEPEMISIDSFVETPQGTYKSEYGEVFDKQTMIVEIPPNAKDVDKKIIRKYPESQIVSHSNYSNNLCIPIKVLTPIGLIDTEICLDSFVNLAKKTWQLFKDRNVTPETKLPKISIMPSVKNKEAQEYVWDQFYNWRTRSWGPFKIRLTGDKKDNVWLTFDLYIVWDYGGVFGTEKGKLPEKSMFLNNGEVLIENVKFFKSWGECTITGESGQPINISSEKDKYNIASVRIKLEVNAKSVLGKSHNWILMWDITSAGQASSFNINQGKLSVSPDNLKPDLPVKTTENAPDSKIQNATIKTTKKRILPPPPKP